jgi:hypothetical protein
MKESYKVEKLNNENVVLSTMPTYGSAEWNDYVMEQFTDEEVVVDNGKRCPKCAGLRRVTRLVLGDIISSAPIQFAPSLDVNGPGRATVVYEVQVKFYSDNIVRRVADIADVWHGNTDDIFAAHPAATASTRAEARALRKLLCLNNISAEELTMKDTVAAVRNSVKVEVPTKGEMKESDKMSQAQINLLDKKCKQLNINVLALAKTCGVETEVKEWTKKNASLLIDKMNEMQQTSVSEDCLGYTSWC